MTRAAERPLPSPCPFPPGSREKIRWMRARHSAKQALWHPLDGPRDLEDEAEVTPWDEEMLRTLPLLLAISSADRSTDCERPPRAA